MSFRLSNHARLELSRRGIDIGDVEAVMASPGQIVPEHEGISCYQSHALHEGKPCLLRVMVNEAADPMVIVTVYRTSKIRKYWLP